MMLTHKKLLTTVVGGAIAAAAVATAAPASAATNVQFTYDVTGSTRIGAQVNQTVPLGPSTLKILLDLDTGNFSEGTLPLPSKVVTFPVFGGLATLRATVNFIQSGKITGAQTFDSAGNNVVTANAKYTIKLTDAQFKTPITPFFAPIFVGNTCQTASPVSINLKTPAGQSFDPSAGGNLAGTYTIGQFSGCNALFIPGIGSVIVNSLVPGPNNTIAVTLRNGRITG